MNEEQYFEVKVFGPVGIRTIRAIGIGNVKEVRERKNSLQFQAEVHLEGSVVVKCDDYEYFAELAGSDRRYDDVKATISSMCSGIMAVKWNTYIEIRNGTFDHERKTFEFSFSLDNVNRVFENRKTDVFNILEISSARVSTTAQYAFNIVYTNGVPVYFALLAMFREMMKVGSITSDFFQWNSSNPSYVIGHSDKLHNLALFQKSDIVKASSVGYAPATVLNLTPQDLIENLCKLYNLLYTMDAAGNFRIEHWSWFAPGTGLDITVPRYAKYLIGTREYTFDEPKIFRLEKFENPESINKDFIGVPIEYDNAMIQYFRKAAGHLKTETTEEDTLKRSVSFITDIDGIYGNFGLSESATPDREAGVDGIVLLALSASGNIEKVNGILETTPTQRRNNVNSWAVLHDDYWKVGRLFPEGIMNNTTTAFTGVQRIKLRKKLILPFCCDETLDVDDLVVTEDGDAEIKKATIDGYRNTVELELAYEDTEQTFLFAPTAVNDIYATSISTVLNTSAAGKPSLLANDSGAASALAETKATVLGGTVVIATNGHFVYTPPVGIVGSDEFDYKALSAGGKLDIGKAQIIIKVAGVYIHAAHTEYYTQILGTGGAAVYWRYRILIQFFEDPFLQIPLDLAGYGISIPYSWTVYGFVGSTTPLGSGSGTAVVSSGNFVEIGNSGYTQTASGGVPTSSPVFSITLTPSGSYTIV